MSAMEVPPFHIQLNTSDDESENESLVRQFNFLLNRYAYILQLTMTTYFVCTDNLTILDQHVFFEWCRNRNE